MKNGAAKADRNFPNFSEFSIFFTFEQKWPFKLSSGEEFWSKICKYFFKMVMRIAKSWKKSRQPESRHFFHICCFLSNSYFCTIKQLAFNKFFVWQLSKFSDHASHYCLFVYFMKKNTWFLLFLLHPKNRKNVYLKKIWLKLIFVLIVTDIGRRAESSPAE